MASEIMPVSEMPRAVRAHPFLAPCAMAIAALAVVLVVPQLGLTSYMLHVLVLGLIWSLFGVGWNIVAGFAGTVAFGHQAFFAIGAYGSALLSMRTGLSPWFTMWLAALIAAFIGTLMSIPVLRIRSIPQVAIVTLAFAEIVRILIVNLHDLTRGEQGLIGFPGFPALDVPLLGTLQFGPADQASFFYLTASLLVLVSLSIAILMRSSYGLSIIAIKNSQDAAESLGINAGNYRIALFGLSSLIVGLAGAVYGHFIMILTPSDTAGSGTMIMVMAMVIMGGIGTVWGPIIGALLCTFGLESFRALEDYRLLLFGGMVVLVIRVAPAGLVSIVAPCLVLLRRSKTSGSTS